MLTVSQLNARIKRLLEDDLTLRNLWLTGEVSNFVQASSGHCYFTLKDQRASIPCVMWRNDAQRLPRLPVDGEQVLIHGRVSVYQDQGRVQFYADTLEPAGLGRLYQELEALKARLEGEGLFSQERKRSLPRWPRRIGVITSARAAALRDILRTLAARYPLAEVLLAPAAVQGVEAPPQIVAAIQQLNRWALDVEPIDLIIVARGGGSIEELWAFDDERVVRAIAESRLPVISGVGHETDFTLADFVADYRAPTPTGAATAATPDRLDLAAQVQALRSLLSAIMGNRLAGERMRLEQARRSLQRSSPEAQIANRRQQVDDLSQAAGRAMGHSLALRQTRLQGLTARLRSLDPQAVLARGYAIVRRAEDQEIITTVGQVQSGQRLQITVSDGDFESEVI